MGNRVFDTIKQMDKEKGLLHIPVVMQENALSYKDYRYEGEEHASEIMSDERDEDEDIFVDTKKIQEEALKRRIVEEEEGVRRRAEEEIRRRQAEEEQRRRAKYQAPENPPVLSSHEMYLRNLEYFMEHDERKEQVMESKKKRQPGTVTYPSNKKKRGGRRNKQGSQLEGPLQTGELPGKQAPSVAAQQEENILCGGSQGGKSSHYFDASNINQLQFYIDNSFEWLQIYERSKLPPLQYPSADLKAAAYNTHSTKWEVLFNTITHLRQILCHHWEFLFAPDVNLKQLVEDVAKVGDSLKLPVALNTMVLIQELCPALKSSLDHSVTQLAEVCLRRAVDTNDLLREEAKKALIQIAVYLHEGKVLEFVINRWVNDDFMVMIGLGLVMEKLVPRIGRNYQLYQGKCQALTHDISQMVCSKILEMRRLGKKVFFKFLSSEADKADVRLKVEQLENDYCRQKMLCLIEEFKKLFVGVERIDESEYVPSSQQNNRRMRPNQLQPGQDYRLDF